MKVSREEIKQGALTPENLAVALRSLRECGYVTLADALPKAWVTKVRTACDALLKPYVEDREDAKEWFQMRRGHVGMMAPMRMPLMDPLAIENPLALQIMEAAMGPDIFCTFYNTNTAWPGSGVQRLHRDSGHLFPDYPYPLPVTSVVLNIPLVDYTLEIGSTEVWPGTHLIADVDPADREKLEERAALLPSVRTNMPAGSLVVRDLRMWHRGMPNRTQTIRTMLAIVYNRPFLRVQKPMEIPRATWEQMSEHARHLFRYNVVVD